jgi:hypothetical protein
VYPKVLLKAAIKALTLATVWARSKKFESSITR